MSEENTLEAPKSGGLAKSSRRKSANLAVAKNSLPEAKKKLEQLKEAKQAKSTNADQGDEIETLKINIENYIDRESTDLADTLANVGNKIIIQAISKAKEVREDPNFPNYAQELSQFFNG